MIAVFTGITVNIVHMGKTTARNKDVMLLLLGIPPKLIFFNCKA